MKWFSTAVLVSLATVCDGRKLDVAEELRQKWNMDEPNITYTSENNTFHLDFNTTNATGWMYEHIHLQEEFYDANCKDDGSGYVEYVVPKGIYEPNTRNRPYLQINNTTDTVYLEFEINTTELANDPNIYGIIDPIEALEMGWEDKVNWGRMRFCVRSSLGYDGVVNQSSSVQYQIETYGFKEVNFIESLINVFYDLSAGFTVSAFNVDPKERVETTAQKDAFGLVAWLCNKTATPITETYEDPYAPSRTMPAPVDSGFVNTTDNPDDNPYAEYFNQGALITVCVAPDEAAWRDGIRLNGINEFDWVRNDLNTTAADSTADGTPDTVAGDYLAYGSNPQIIQPAIIGGFPAANQLTSYVPSECNFAAFCEFSSILYADFYLARGVVFGAGSANLIYSALPARRKLELTEDVESGEQPHRELQFSESSFDVSVPLTTNDDGPPALRTAGTASFGFAVLTSAMVLLGTALLV